MEAVGRDMIACPFPELKKYCVKLSSFKKTKDPPT